MDALAFREVGREASEGAPLDALPGSSKMVSRLYRGRGPLDGGLLLPDVVAAAGWVGPVERLVESEVVLARRDGPA